VVWVIAIAALFPPAVPAQGTCGDALAITVEPPPRAGTFFRVVVSGAPPGATLDGTAGGEPLHFTPTAADTTTASALAGAGLEAGSSLGIRVTCRVGARLDSASVTVALTPGTYPTERLRVAPRFTAPLDSALAERVAREGARAREAGRLAHHTPSLQSPRWTRPRPSRITSAFGRGREFNGVVTSRHLGTDFAGAVGAPVVAANRGIVRIVDRFYFGGNVIYLDHGDGISTAYLHLSRQLVAEGDTVQPGQVIGRVGATGRVTGPHLHLIARYGTMSLDPMTLPGMAARR
jgi:murein DD-endopeptidase MepM/ murein hydrolase activator NlpD